MPISKPNLKIPQLKSLSLTVVVFSAFLVVVVLALYFDREGVFPLPDFLSSRLRSLSVIISTFFLVSLFLRLTIKNVFKLFEEPEEKIFYSKIYSWFFYSIAIFIMLNQLGVSIGNITLFIGLLTTGLAFAVRDVLLSFFGWIILLRKKPFRIGDYIKIGDDEGRVMHIGTFYVLMDNTPEMPEDYTRVPNRLFLEKSIVNLGKTHCLEKIVLNISSIPERTKIDEARKTISHLVGNNDYTKIALSVEKNLPALHVKYLVAFEQKESVKSDVILLLNDFFKENIFFAQNMIDRIK